MPLRSFLLPAVLSCTGHNGHSSSFELYVMNKKIERVKTALQIDDNINLHITGWILQRIGWGLMFIFLVCAALGLFGQGVLSRAQISHAGITIKYERFFRREAKMELEIISTRSMNGLQVVLPPDFTRNFEVEGILPQPAEQKISEGSVVMSFAAQGAGEIAFFLKPRQAGNSTATIKINETDFKISQFIYP